MKIVHIRENNVNSPVRQRKSVKSSALNWMMRQEAKDRRKASKMFEAEKIAIGMIPSKKIANQ